MNFIEIGNSTVLTAEGSDLCKFLKIRTKWLKRKLAEYDFREGGRYYLLELTAAQMMLIAPTEIDLAKRRKLH